MVELNASSTYPALRVAKAHREQMLQIAESVLPQEACGILAGKDGVSRHVYQVTNILASVTQYLMDPEEMVKVFLELEQNNLEEVAFFHSHPHSLPIPSQTDLSSHYYPEVPQIILGRPAEKWLMRAYYLFPDHFEEISLIIV